MSDPRAIIKFYKKTIKKIDLDKPGKREKWFILIYFLIIHDYHRAILWNNFARGPIGFHSMFRSQLEAYADYLNLYKNYDSYMAVLQATSQNRYKYFIEDSYKNKNNSIYKLLAGDQERGVKMKEKTSKKEDLEKLIIKGFGDQGKELIDSGYAITKKMQIAGLDDWYPVYTLCSMEAHNDIYRVLDRHYNREKNRINILVDHGQDYFLSVVKSSMEIMQFSCRKLLKFTDCDITLFNTEIERLEKNYFKNF